MSRDVALRHPGTAACNLWFGGKHRIPGVLPNRAFRCRQVLNVVPGRPCAGRGSTIPSRNPHEPTWTHPQRSDQPIAPGDLKEDLIHSLQKYVEVDEPEPEAMPLIGSPGTGVDADDTEVVADRMTEEELLKGLEGLAPPEEKPEPVEPDDEE